MPGPVARRPNPLVLAGAVVLCVVGIVAVTVREVRIGALSRAVGMAASDPGADAPDTTGLLRDAVREAREDVEAAVLPAVRRTESIAGSPEVLAALAHADHAALRRIANDELRDGARLDAVAFVDREGRLVAVNTQDAAGRPLPAERIERLLAQDPSGRTIVSGCLRDGQRGPIVEFETDCELVRILWEAAGFAVACSAPVVDPATGREVGAVTTRIRFDRIQPRVDDGERPGLDLMVVGARGGIMEPGVPGGGEALPIDRATLAALGDTLGARGTSSATLSSSAGGIACAYPIDRLHEASGAPVMVVGYASPRLVSEEAMRGRLTSAATLAGVASLTALSGSLLVRSRSQRRTQAVLVAARNEAEAASRAKTEFLANMSHEIRTPMTAILGYADLLAEHGDPLPNAPTREEAAETIRRNARHLLSVINDVLDLSKIEAGQMGVDRQRVRTLELAQDALRMMDERARQKGLALRLVLDGEVPDAVTTDPTRLRQVLINLLGNAVKFTDRGSVTLSLRRPDPAGRMLEIEVADTGIGMTPEQMSRLYQPFMQADHSTARRYGGTGLGLAITRRCADLLGGGISVRSAPGAGTIFTVSIDAGDLSGAEPARLREPERGAGDEGPAPSAAQRPLCGMRVLLAEDGIDNRRLIRFHLERAGAHVDVAADGAEAVARMLDSSRRDRHDVVLMDMQMPVMDGFEAVRRLRAAGARVPVVALTAHAMPGDRERCLEAGCTDYLSKPIDPAAMVAAVRHAIAPPGGAAPA